jgi:Na+/H+-dicarboxylate symporter
MLRTAVNITGDAACATIVDRFREPGTPSAKDEALAPTANH